MNVRAFDSLGATSAALISPGRAGAMVAVVAGLTGVVLGALALRARRVGTDGARRGAVGALVAGLIGVALGGLVVATAGGGLGTGHGLGGGVVALVVGSVSMVLGGLARARS